LKEHVPAMVQTMEPRDVF